MSSIVGDDVTADADSLLGAATPTQSSSQASTQGGFALAFQQRDGSGYVTGSYLKHPTHADSKNIFAIAATTGYDHRVNMQFIQSPVIFTDKSIFIDLWKASESFDNLQNAPAPIEIWIGHDVLVSQTATTGDYYKFYISQEDIVSEQWFNYECVYGSHDAIEGVPNPNAVDGVAVVVNDASSESSWNGNSLDWGFTWAVGGVTIGTPSIGTWLGDYKFFYNWEYDDGQHSQTYEFSGQGSPLTIETKILEVKTFTQLHGTSGAFLRREDSSTSSATVRITGANIFYAEYDSLGIIIDSDKRFLINMDFGKGVRKTLFDEFTAFDSGDAPTGGRTHPAITVKSPTSIDSFATVGGYPEGDKLNHVRFGSALYLNNRSYVGNVAVMDNNDNIITYADRIYKSVANQPDVYTKHNYLEVAPNDGESITALASYGDYLLEFKTSTMHLINVTQDSEYLEESYAFRGVHDDHAVANVSHGICWANNYGLFLFDGKEVKNLLGIKIDRDWWNLNATNPTVAYDPIKDEIVVFLRKAGWYGIRYSIVKEHFILVTDETGGSYGAITNPVTEPSGQIIYVGKNTTMKYYRFTSTGDTNIDIETRDEVLDDPGRLKSLKKVYINYKNTDDTVPAINYKKDNGVQKDFDVPFVNTSGAWTTTAFKPAVSAEANNGYSYKIRISGTADNSFAVNDISLIYREKSVK